MSVKVNRPGQLRKPLPLGNGIFRSTKDSSNLGFMDFPHRGVGFDVEYGCWTDDLVIYVLRGNGGNVNTFGAPFLYQAFDGATGVQVPNSLFANEPPMQLIGKAQYNWPYYNGSPWIMAWAKKATRLDQKTAKVYRVNPNTSAPVQFNYNQLNVYTDTYKNPLILASNTAAMKSNLVGFNPVLSPNRIGASGQYNQTVSDYPPDSLKYPFLNGSNLGLAFSHANYDEFFDKAFSPAPVNGIFYGPGAAIGNGWRGRIAVQGIVAYSELIPADGRTLGTWGLDFKYPITGSPGDIPTDLTIPWASIIMCIGSNDDLIIPDTGVKMYDGFKESFTDNSALSRFTIGPDSESLVAGVPYIE